MRIFFFSPDWDPYQRSIGALAKKKLCVPPLGVLYLASAAKRAGHDVYLYDEQVEGAVSKEELCKKVKAFGADMFGSSVITVSYDYTEEISAHLKKEIPGLVTVAGGPHITVMPEKSLNSAFDYLFIGDSDEAFPEFLNQWSQGIREFRGLKGICYRSGNEIINTGKGLLANLITLPFPDRGLLNGDYFVKLPSGEVARTTGILLTRGCPFKCAFCAEAVITEHRFRKRDGVTVADEVERIQKEFGITHFSFYDSTLTINRKLLENFCHEIIRRGIKITWEGWTRANMIDHQLATLMKQAGFVRMAIGVESGNEHILELIQKKVKLQEIRDCFKMLKEVGITTESFAMIGLPGETRETMYNTARFLRSISEIRYTSLGLVIPYPGTLVYEYAKNNQHGLRLLSEDYREYHRYGKGVMEVAGMSPKTLARMQKKMIVLAHLTPYKLYSLIRHFGFFSLLKVYIEWFFEALLPKVHPVGAVGANKWREDRSPASVHFSS